MFCEQVLNVCLKSAYRSGVGMVTSVGWSVFVLRRMLERVVPKECAFILANTTKRAIGVWAPESPKEIKGNMGLCAFGAKRGLL